MAKKTKEQSYSVINSPEIAPYRIYVEESQFTVVLPSGTYEKTFGYYATLAGALNKITKLKVLEVKEFTLDGYINRFQEVQDKLLQAVKL